MTLLSVASLPAQSLWTGDGANDDWSTGENWDAGIPPTSDPATAVQFAGSTRLTPDTDSPWTIGSLAFNSGAGAFTLGGATLTLADGGTITNSSASLQTIANSEIVLSGASTWDTAAGNLAVNSALSGAGALAKAGAARLVLNGTNTYSGNTTVSAGTLQFSRAASLYNGNTTSWTAANLIVQSGATAAFNVGGAGEFTASDIEILQPLGTSTGGFKNGSLIGLDTTNASGGTFTYSAPIASTNGGANVVSLEKLGAGTLVLSGNSSSYWGHTVVRSGALTIPSGARFGHAIYSEMNPPSLTVGERAGENASVTVAGALYAYTHLGYNGSGTMTIEDGGFVDGLDFLGGNSTGVGVLNMNAGSLAHGYQVTVGYDGHGTINIQDGARLDIDYALVLGDGGGSGGGAHGTMTVSGAGSFVDIAWGGGPSAIMYVGGAGTGTLNILNGGRVNGGDTVLGYYGGFGGYGGTATVSGAGSLLQVTHLQIGRHNTGTLTIDSGGEVRKTAALGSTLLFMNFGDGGAGTLNFGSYDLNNPTTTGLLTGFTGIDTGVGNTVIHFNQTDTATFGLRITGAGNVVQRGSGTTVFTGNAPNTYTGMTTVSAGELHLNRTGVNAIGGNVTISGGVLKLLAGNQIADSSAMLLSGGTFDIGASSDTVGAVTLSSGMIAGTTGVLTGSNYNMRSGSVSAILGGSGALTKTTSGTVTLTGANLYSGGTNVTGGILKANNTTGSATGSGQVTVGASGTFGGSGSVAGGVILNGTLSPGNSIGHLTTGSLIAGATGFYEWEISDATSEAGTGWDLVTVNGSLTFNLGATFKVVSINLQNFDSAENFSWLVATADSGIGGWESVTLNLSGFTESYAGAFALGVSGNELTLHYTAPIPEPSALALIALAFGGICWARYRKDMAAACYDM